MPQEPTTGVREGVQVTDRVTQVTRVFLAGAISLGAIASAMGFFLLPDLIGGGGTSQTRNAPLVASDVTAVASAVGVDMNQDRFYPLEVDLGSTPAFRLLYPAGEEAGNDYVDLRAVTRNQNVILKASSTTASGWNFFGLRPKAANAQATPFSIESIQGATTFSIEPIPAPPFINTQILRFAYKQYGSATERKINICVGVTTNTTVYVGADGSTYLDKNLTRRTTDKTCPQILARGFQPGEISGSDFAQDEAVALNPTNEFWFHRTGGHLTTVHQDGDVIANGPARPDFFDPLSVTYRGSAPSNNEADPFVIPDTVITAKDYSKLLPDGISPTVTPLCFPGTTLTHGNTGVRYYFDTTGRAYKDIMLSQPASSVRCDQLFEKALGISKIDTMSVISMPTTDLGDADKLLVKNARFIAGEFSWADRIYTQLDNHGDDRGAMALRFELPNRPAGTTVTVPDMYVHVVGEHLMDGGNNIVPVDAKLCYPQTTLHPADAAPGQMFYYFDKRGNAYTDLFLTKPALTTDCADALARGYAPESIFAATAVPSISPVHGIWVGSGSYLYGVIDGGSWVNRQPDQGTYEGYPFFLALTGSNDPLTIQKVTVSVYEHDQTTKKDLCWGGWTNATAISRSTAVFYDRSGNGFTDLFLTKPYTCPSGVITYSNIKAVPTATSVTITWDTNLNTCGNINYGTVSGALNSGPIKGTCGVTGHTATIPNLTAGTTYYFEIVSLANPPANPLYGSGQKTFTTTSSTSGSGGGSGPLRIPDTVE